MDLDNTWKMELWWYGRQNENMTTMTTFTLKSSILGTPAGPLDMPPPVHLIKCLAHNHLQFMSR